jgi:hypothetical protein
VNQYRHTGLMQQVRPSWPGYAADNRAIARRSSRASPDARRYHRRSSQTGRAGGYVTAARASAPWPQHSSPRTRGRCRRAAPGPRGSQPAHRRPRGTCAEPARSRPSRKQPRASRRARAMSISAR